MPRFFVAIPLPDDAKNCLIAAQPPVIPGMRVLGREELHLTLHFLGEIAPHHVGVVGNALANVRMNAFAITISGVGRFPPEGEAQVLWAGVEASTALIELHRAIGTVLAEAIGFRPEERPYSPHVTLARLNSPAPPDLVEMYLEGRNGFVLQPVPIDRFVLYSSSFVDGVPQYREEAVFSRLGSPSP